MNKEQKVLIKKFEASVGRIMGLSKDELKAYDELIKLGILNESAFTKTNGGFLIKSEKSIYGSLYLKQKNINWYIKLRESILIKIVRDLGSVLGLVAAIIIAISKLR